MNGSVRLILSLICGCILLFCCFGIMATFEPLERSVQITWRAIYGTVAVLSVAGIVAMNRRRGGNDTDA